MQDTNGNQILVRYKSGLGTQWTDSSARLDEIEDVRADTTCCPQRWRTYSFAYNSDPIPHLQTVTNHINTAEGYTLNYTTNAALWSPFAPASTYGSYQTLQSVAINGIGLSTSFEYHGFSSGELTKVTFPYGGDIGWDYREFEFTGQRKYREIEYRRLRKQSTLGQVTYTFTRTRGIRR